MFSDTPWRFGTASGLVISARFGSSIRSSWLSRQPKVTNRAELGMRRQAGNQHRAGSGMADHQAAPEFRDPVMHARKADPSLYLRRHAEAVIGDDYVNERTPLCQCDPYVCGPSVTVD